MIGHANDSSERDLRRLQSEIGHQFADIGLLELALTHSSVEGSSVNGHRSNERLEFLGDRVLGLVIADMIYTTFPDEEEGSMARRHASLVRREALAAVAVKLDLSDHIRMSRGEFGTGGHRNRALLSNTCEAVIAAIYLDAGWQTAAQFVNRNWRPLLDAQAAPPIDAKTALQEWAQGKGLHLPEYRETERRGPAHAPTFSVEVSVQGLPPLTATGPSKRMAEKAAAEALLTRVHPEGGK